MQTKVFQGNHTVIMSTIYFELNLYKKCQSNETIQETKCQTKLLKHPYQLKTSDLDLQATIQLTYLLSK